MKKIIFLICLQTVAAFGATPLTECPSGASVADSTYAGGIELYSGSCPSGMLTVGTAVSCMERIVAGCILYAPVGMSFVENGHTYEFDGVCPLSH